MNYKVVVITVNYHQNEYTLKCIESILSSNYNNFKIILIDNGPIEEEHKKLINSLPDDDRVILKKSKENIGYVGGINLGLELGSKINPDYFMIMNNDTTLDKNAIGELIKTCKKYNDKAIVTGKVYHYDQLNVIQYIGSKLICQKTLKYKFIGLDEYDYGQYDEVAERDMIDDIFWLFPIFLYEKTGGYSPHFWFNGESTDYALRARKFCYKLIYTPHAKLWHKGSVSVGGRENNPEYAYWSTKSSITLRYLHLSRLNFLFYFICFLKSTFATTIKSLIFYIEGNNSLIKYASSKRRGLIDFINWLIKNNTHE